MVDNKAWLELREFSQLSSSHRHISAILAAMCVKIGKTMGAAMRQQELMGWSFLAQNFGSYLNQFWVDMAQDTHYNHIIGEESEYEIRVESAVVNVFSFYKWN